jgi:hypothetical protein
MESPNSFCSIATKNCKDELIILLKSLEIHHPNTNIYIMTDTETKHCIKQINFKPGFNIIIKNNLDKYSSYTRTEMVELKIWNEFQMKKADVIYFALENEKDTLFLDSDILILGKIKCIDKTKNLGVSPHYIKKSETDKYGYYNGGVLWTNKKSIRDKWYKYAEKSRYFDQAAIEDLVKDPKYKHFEFGEEYNVGWWRLSKSNETPNTILTYFTYDVISQKIYYKDKKIKFVHTHFNNGLQMYKLFNDIIKYLLRNSYRYQELSLISSQN